MSVDNRYTGVGYDPPFETPTDKDFMASHIDSLEAELAEIKRSYREIVDSPCGTDMLHCACVPALRAEIVALRSQVEFWRGKADERGDEIKAHYTEHSKGKELK